MPPHSNNNMEEQTPSMPIENHLQICRDTDEDEGTTLSMDDEESFNTPLPVDPEKAAAVESEPLLDDDRQEQPSGGEATVFQTSLNIAKMCCGTGTLALPFAAEKGGLLFNLIGLFLIGLWNYYCANCLLRCSQFLPSNDRTHESKCEVVDGDADSSSNGQGPAYGSMDSSKEQNVQHDGDDQIHLPPRPPDGTTAYGCVAWYASGPKGLIVLDLLMFSLFFGLLIAYEVAMMSFIDGTPYTTGSRKLDLMIPTAIVMGLSCAPDYGFLSKFSAVGLMAVGLSFIVIAWQGFQENGLLGFRNILDLNLWPESLSAASSWFGVVVFGFGVVPFVFNFRESMAKPQGLHLSLQIGLFLVYLLYIAIAVGIRVLFSPSYSFDGDVLQAMPNTWISLLVRLLMTFVVSVTAPLLVIPCGELVEGKLGIDITEQSSMYKRILIRVVFCMTCYLFAECVPNGFVHVVSFIGCFCVAMVGFVLPPLFCIQLSSRKKCWQDGLDLVLLCDVMGLIVGIIATSITSVLTFRELIGQVAIE